MRQLLEAASTPERLRALWQRNLVTLAMLKRNLPALKSDKDQHYADILTALYKRRLREMYEEASQRQRGAETPTAHGRKDPASAGAQKAVAQQKDAVDQIKQRNIDQWRQRTAHHLDHSLWGGGVSQCP